jgi:uracil-DNA glycosylase
MVPSNSQSKASPQASALSLAHALVATLPSGVPGLFNPWVDHCADDLPGNGPNDKLQRLAAFLDCAPRFIVCGEAPGHLGCRHSGIAFTSERLLLEGAIPRVAREAARLTSRKLPFSEPSATIVWRVLRELGIEQETLLWNALQMHPHAPGNPRSNRTPTRAELLQGAPAMRLLVEAFPDAQLVAVGRKAEELLREMGIAVAGQVRHPANGGATAFAEGLRALVRSSGGMECPATPLTTQSLFRYPTHPPQPFTGAHRP